MIIQLLALNPFKAKQFIIITTHTAPSLLGVTETLSYRAKFGFAFFFFGKRQNFYPRTMEISQKVSAT